MKHGLNKSASDIIPNHEQSISFTPANNRPVAPANTTVNK